MRLLLSNKPKILPRLLPEFAPWLGSLVTPSNGNLSHAIRMLEEHGLPWAADNEAYSDFDPAAYRGMLARIAGHPGCLFVTVPDMVGSAHGTLYLWQQWAVEAEETCQQPLALVAQNGLERCEIPWGEFEALFVGGSPECSRCLWVRPADDRRKACPHCRRPLEEWKLSPAAAGLMAEAKKLGKHVHMGRVNTFGRYRKAKEMGADTVDGTKVVKFSDQELPRAVRCLRGLDSQAELSFAERSGA